MLNDLKRMNKYTKILASMKTEADSGYTCHVVHDEDRRSAAKHLHTRVYLDRGYLQSHQVDENGHATIEADPHQTHSQYFIATRLGEDGVEEVVATARQIIATDVKLHESFQTVTDQALYKRAEEAIRSINPQDCVEVSGLAKERSVPTLVTFMLYRKMWQYSIKSNHKLWIMSCDENLFGRLSFLFGDAFTQIGEKSYYKGHNVVPAALEIERSLDIVINSTQSLNPLKRKLKKQLIDFFLEGLPVEYLRPRQYQRLEALRLVKKPKAD